MVEPRDLIVRSLKVLTRHAAHALCRLADVAVAPDQIRFEDTAVSLSEFRADRILLLGAEDEPARWGWHLEYQLEPDARVMRGWLLKNAAFNARLNLPVVLTVVYLTKGDRATFADTYRVEGGGRRNAFIFDTLRLCEHADRIRGGDLPELAPLLVLCEDTPTEETLPRERELILRLEAEPVVKAEMLGVALTVGLRSFGREVLQTIFRQEMAMVKEVSELLRELFAEELAEGRAESRAEGEALAARRMLLRQLQEKFGELPPAVVEEIERTDRETCEELGVRLLRAESLDALGIGRAADQGTRSTP